MKTTERTLQRDIAKLLRDAVRENDLRSVEIARRGGLHRSHVSRILNGKETVKSLRTLAKLAQAFDLPVTITLRGTGR